LLAKERVVQRSVDGVSKYTSGISANALAAYSPDLRFAGSPSLRFAKRGSKKIFGSMKKEEVPQDLSALGKITKEVCYATDNSGKYVTELSKGWEIKITALDAAWQEVDGRIAAAKQKVLNNEASPLLFFMEKGLMDISILAGYTGFWKWQVKMHLKPDVFKNLSEKKLQRYAEVFNVSIDDLKNRSVHEA